eukprot:COSAG06_NODE_31244_length_524_cov_2.054118_1_plen_166_part_01
MQPVPEQKPESARPQQPQLEGGAAGAASAPASVVASSVKELSIEVGLAQIDEQWEDMVFEFANYKSRDSVLLRGVADVMGVVEETQMTLGGMMSSRYVMPFKEEVSGWVMKMSTVAEIIEKWVIVQNMWTYMEAVFSSDDIAKQLPQQAKKFEDIDKKWMEIMTYS